MTSPSTDFGPPAGLTEDAAQWRLLSRHKSGQRPCQTVRGSKDGYDDEAAVQFPAICASTTTSLLTQSCRFSCSLSLPTITSVACVCGCGGAVVVGVLLVAALQTNGQASPIEVDARNPERS